MFSMRMLRVIFLVLLSLILSGAPLWSQSEDTEIKLSDSFLKSLDEAFSFKPEEAPIVPPDETLSRRQLREWIGPVDTTLLSKEKSQSKGTFRDSAFYAQKFDSTYKALRLWEVEFLSPEALAKATVTLPPVIKIPGLTDHVAWKSKNGRYSVINTSDGHSVLSGLDVNALAKYIRPSQIRLRKSRKLAEKNRATMDALFPLPE